MADHQSRSSHLSVVPHLSDAVNVLEISQRAGARALATEVPAPVAVAELTRSSDPLVVLTSLADKLLSMGYDCLIDVVSQQRPRWSVTRGCLDSELAPLTQVADSVLDESLTLCNGTLVGVGFRGPQDEPESLLLAAPSEGDASRAPAAMEPAETANPANTANAANPVDSVAGAGPIVTPEGSTSGIGQDSGGSGCSCGRQDSDFVGAVVVRRPQGLVTAVDAEVVHSVVEHALGVVAAERLREQLDRQRDRVQHLEQALSTNREIGVAIGILMAGRRCNAEEAFAVLRSVSQNSNRKIRDIAAQLAYTGELPVPPPKRAVETACGSVPAKPDPKAVSARGRVARHLQPR